MQGGASPCELRRVVFGAVREREGFLHLFRFFLFFSFFPFLFRENESVAFRVQFAQFIFFRKESLFNRAKEQLETRRSGFAVKFETRRVTSSWKNGDVAQMGERSLSTSSINRTDLRQVLGSIPSIST